MSPNIKKVYFLLAGLIILALFIAVRQGKLPGTMAKSGVTTVSTQSLETKTDSQGSVSVEVTPTTLRVSEKPEFQVSFNTHSVDLDFSIERIAKLADQNGRIIGSASWDGAPPGGHHRSGKLLFDTVLPVGTKNVTLTLTDIGGATRTFTWTTQQP